MKLFSKLTSCTSLLLKRKQIITIKEVKSEELISNIQNGKESITLIEVYFVLNQNKDFGTEWDVYGMERDFI